MTGVKLRSSFIKKKRSGGDHALLIAVAALTVIGTVFIYSASNYSARATYGDGFFFVKKQVIGIILGLAAMLFTAFYDYEKLKKFTIPVSVVSFVLLGLVFVPGVGVENYGAKRWIGFGAFTVQPSSLLSPCLPRIFPHIRKE